MKNSRTTTILTKSLGWIWGCIHNTSISLQLMNRLNLLECYIKVGRKGMPDTNTLTLRVYSKVKKKLWPLDRVNIN
jgi:hypothetical protein